MKDLPTPLFAVDEEKLTRNLEILQKLESDTGCKVLLAQKAFSCYSFYPLISSYISGTCSSGLYEARLAHEEFCGESHVYSPAYRDEDFDEIASLCDHIVFNGFSQLDKFKDRCHGASAGIRVNPRFSTQGGGIYDPCRDFSRLGVTSDDSEIERLFEVEGVHMHTMCEQGAEDLVSTVEALEKSFGKYLFGKKWINLGGGQHMTKQGYNLPLLEREIKRLEDRYGAQIYLEPGEAVALGAGFLYARVLDIAENGKDIAILDCSAECHMPDVLEMPYRPRVTGENPEGKYSYVLSSATCLAGDEIGEYRFDEPLKVGDVLRFEDMAIYSMVKTNTFCGTPLPAIARKRGEDFEILKTFGYSDFKGRL